MDSLEGFDHLTCGISLEIPKEPRMLPSCEHLFERVEIEKWLKVKSECPLCRTKLPQSTVKGNSPFLIEVAPISKLASAYNVVSAFFDDLREYKPTQNDDGALHYFVLSVVTGSYSAFPLNVNEHVLKKEIETLFLESSLFELENISRNYFARCCNNQILEKLDFLRFCCRRNTDQKLMKYTGTFFHALSGIYLKLKIST